MAGVSASKVERVVIGRDHLPDLFEVLKSKGYLVVGPIVREGAITLGPLDSPEELPRGFIDEQDGGTYRLKQIGDGSYFRYAVGPHSAKKYLLPSTLRLWSAKREGNGFRVIPEDAAPPRIALIGIRSCDLHAIAIQDKVLLGGSYADPTYRAQRENLFIIVVNCTRAGGTCFCVSMGTGPRATVGYDLALTEVLEGERHEFLLEAGSPRGAEVFRDLPRREAREEDLAQADRRVKEAAASMGRELDTDRIKELLYGSYEHPRWEEVAGRCLTCANCTMVCPTCFCTTVEDVTDLSGDHAERWRKLDSCFTLDFSYLHGGSIRTTPRSRYRQWMTHKLATWIDQFGTSGCVGCGRCITWCPVAIDITEEVRAIRSTDSRPIPANSKEELSRGDA